MFEISIIVCTRNRCSIIVSCLNSIATAIAKANLNDKAEIILVDNGSTDATQEIVETWKENNIASVKYIYEPIPGLSQARNTGISHAQGKIFVFTDDDCRLHENYLEVVIKHFSQDTEMVIRGGRIDLGNPGDLSITVNYRSTYGQWNKKLNSARFGNICDHILGCNMAASSNLIQTVGHFTTLLGAGRRIPAGEDSDYIMRCYLAGASLEYLPDMAVSHYHGRKTKEEGFALFRGYMMGSGALYVRYVLKEPNLIRPFIWDVKNAIIEILKNKNTFMPSIGFSHKHKIFYALCGAITYIFTSKNNA